MPIQYAFAWTLIVTAGVLSATLMAAVIDQPLPLLDRVFSSSSVNNSAKGETKSNHTVNIYSMPALPASSVPNITKLPLQHRSDDSILIEAPMLDPIVIVAAPDLSGATTIFKNGDRHHQASKVNGVPATTKFSSEISPVKTESATYSLLPGSSMLYSLAGVDLLEEADPRLQMAESLKARFPVSTRTSDGAATEKASKARSREDVDDSVEVDQHEAENFPSKYKDGDDSRESRSNKSPNDLEVYLDIGDTGATGNGADYHTEASQNNHQPYYDEEDGKLDTLYRGDLPRPHRYTVRNHRDHPENPRLIPGGSNNLDEEDVINVHQTIKNNPDSHDGLQAHRPTPSSFGSEINGFGLIGGEDIDTDIDDDVMDDLDEPILGEHVGGTGFRSATTPGSSDGSLPGDDFGEVSNVGSNVAGNNVPIPSGPIGDDNPLFDSTPSSSGEFFGGPEFGGAVNGRNRFPGRGAYGLRQLNSQQQHGRWHHGHGRGMVHGRYHPGIVHPRHMPWQLPRNMYGKRHMIGRH